MITKGCGPKGQETRGQLKSDRNRPHGGSSHPAVERRRSGSIRPAVPVRVFLASVLCVAACGFRSDGFREELEPVAECTAYEKAANSCYRTEFDIAHQAALMPKTKIERDQVARLCGETLARLVVACR
jgi:hypothetical protein